MLSGVEASAQDTIKIETIKSTKDIPHKTGWQKWMWIHRSIAFNIILKNALSFLTPCILNPTKKILLLPFRCPHAI